MISVFQLDDHEIVRRGLAEVLRAEDDIVGEAATAAQALPSAPQALPSAPSLLRQSGRHPTCAIIPTTWLRCSDNTVAVRRRSRPSQVTGRFERRR
jgi:hypothetical protein